MFSKVKARLYLWQNLELAQHGSSRLTRGYRVDGENGAQKTYAQRRHEGPFVKERRNYLDLLGRLPKSITISSFPDGNMDMIQIFSDSKSKLQELLSKAEAPIKLKSASARIYHKGSFKKE